MRVLGIETSCDETAVSIIAAEGDFAAGDFSCTIDGDALLSHMLAHVQYGGVFPNVAKRKHAENLLPVFEQALTEAGMLTPHAKAPEVSQETLTEIKELLAREPELFARLTIFLAQYQKPHIDAIAVTVGPGLEPALWVGVNFARALSLAWDIPIVPVNHMEGHILIALMCDENPNPETRNPKQMQNQKSETGADSRSESATVTCNLSPVTFPALALLISGGHSELVLMQDWMAYEKIGQTRDDAVGEAFDKVARLLGLPYPGGPAISRLAKEAREQELKQPFTLPRAMLDSGGADFSFSGIKTAVRRIVEELSEPNEEQKRQIAREFEDAVAEIFVAKVRGALHETGAYTLILGGGVAANTYIKAQLAELLASEFPHTTLYVSPPEHSTDNALMIALAGYFHALRGEYAKQGDIAARGTKHFRKQSDLAPQQKS